RWARPSTRPRTRTAPRAVPPSVQRMRVLRVLRVLPRDRTPPDQPGPHRHPADPHRLTEADPHRPTAGGPRRRRAGDPPHPMGADPHRLTAGGPQVSGRRARPASPVFPAWWASSAVQATVWSPTTRP